MPKAVIFDMDGTMVNTEKLWSVVNHTLSANHGVVYVDEVRRQMMGRKDSECLAVFKDFYKLDTPLEDLIQERRSILLADLSSIQVNAGLYELLELLEKLEIKKAVATSSFGEFTRRIVTIFDLERRYDAIVTADDVQRSKPDPELFLTAAARIGVEPKDCLVLEDAQNGVEAAKHAGMKCIAIPHQYSQSHDFSSADLVLPSMLEITESVLKKI